MKQKLLLILCCLLATASSLLAQNGASVQTRGIVPNSAGNTRNTANTSAALSSDKAKCFPSTTGKDATPVASYILYRDIEQRLQTKQQVRVDLYVMSQCPFGVMAEQALIKLMQEFGNKIDLHLNFIAEEKVQGGRTAFTSMHGQSEVEEDIRQLIIARNYPDKLTGYLMARAENFQNPNWQVPAAKAGIDVNALTIAAAMPESQQLFSKNIQQTQALRVTGSPTLIIDGGVYNGPVFNIPSSSATACQTGSDPFTGSNYVVCAATATSAWISANTGGRYHALYICNSLGYANVGREGGTCGSVCGYCTGGTSCTNPQNNTTFDNSGSNCGSDANGIIFCTTVHWECTGTLCATPTFTPTGNQTASTASNSCTAVVSYSSVASGATSYSYAFTGVTPGSGSGTGTGSTFNKGVTNVAVTATNSCGSTTDNFTVTVTDNTLPVVTAPSNITINGWCINVPAAQVSLGTATVSDNCASAATLNANLSNNAPASYPIGTTNVVWTVSDGNGNTNTATQTVTVSSTSTLTAPSTVTPQYPMAGQETQTIYLGYPAAAQTEDMQVNPTGGTAPYSFAWTRSDCNGSSMSPLTTGIFTSSQVPYYSTATFAPTVADVCLNNGTNDNLYYFNVVVTDAHGCQAPAQKRLNVVNPWVGQIGNSNVMVCHKIAVRGASSYQLMSVTPSQAGLHVAHGDNLGNCTFFNGVKSISENLEQLVAVYPNPTTGTIILEISEVKSDEATISITDVVGREVISKTIGKHDALVSTFDLERYGKGIYLVTVKDGEFSYRTKLVVQ